METGIDWDLIKNGCPQCGKEVHWHTLTVWCNHCSFRFNWEDWKNSEWNKKS